jgi:GTP-binding protein YchF
MKLGIIGLPQTGKKSIFNLLTGITGADNNGGNKASIGIAEIRDDRFVKLVNMYTPRKETPARIDLQLLPKIEENTVKEQDIFKNISDVDALCHIVRAFDDESVYHVHGSIDPERDIEMVNGELLLHDLIFIEKRLERIEKDRKRKDDKRLKDEEELLNKIKPHLENDNPLRTLTLSDEELKIIAGYPFLTRKKMLVVLNINEEKVGENELKQSISNKFSNIDIDVIQVPVKLESEIAMLETEDEKLEFMNDAGIDASALIKLSGLAMRSLGLISYFTVGEDEVRQWLIRNGSSAPEAAGVIHSDIQRGFIRAEMIKYPDLIEQGSEDDVKKAGKLNVMGKDYIVEDGDIISFRFNV